MNDMLHMNILNFQIVPIQNNLQKNFCTFRIFKYFTHKVII